MKLNKILLLIVIIVLCATIYTFINRVYRAEYFDKGPYHSHVPQIPKYDFGLLSIFSKRKCNDGRPSSNLERTYDICHKKIDENQVLNIWEIPWITKDRYKPKLQELWSKLKTAFPNN